MGDMRFDEQTGQWISADGLMTWNGTEWQSRELPSASPSQAPPTLPSKEVLPQPAKPDPTGAEFVLKGVNGQLFVFPAKVTIKRKGFMAKSTQGFFTGDKDLYFHQIGSINVKQGGALTNGFIQFAPVGNVEHRRGLTQQTHDENTVIIRKSQNEEVGRIKAYIEKQMQARDATGAAVTVQAPDKYDQLRKLGELHTGGVLSDAEFEVEKTRLLGG